MKRRIALVLAAVFAAVSLVGCNNNSSQGMLDVFNQQPEETFTEEDIENSKKWLTIEDNVVVECSEEATKVVIPDTVNGIGKQAFGECTNLKAVKIPDSVTEIGNIAFCGCTGLTSIKIPNSVTEINKNAFFGSTGLKSITVDKANPNYSSIDGVLYNKDITSLIVCPEGKIGVVNIPNSVTKIGDDAFDLCTGLTSINIPNSVTEIGQHVFSGCTGLKSIIIPNGVTKISKGAFGGCTGLTSIKLPNSVTEIGENAFAYCTGLTSVNIPDSVTHIGVGVFDYSFDGCENISATYKGKTYDYAHIEDLYDAINS